MKRTTTTLLVLFLFATGLFAAGVDLTGVGIRATNLGGNYRAVSNDWSGMFWNPAGLVFSKGLKAGFSLEFIMPTVGYTSAKSLAGQQFSATSATEIENEPKTFLIPAFGVYYSNEKYAFGLGFYAPFGLGAKWDLLNTTAYNPSYPEFDYEDDLKVMALQPTFAYKLRDNLSVGLGVTFIMADIMIRKPNFTPNPFVYDPNLAGFQQALGAAANSPYDHIITESNMEGDGMGFGANVGLQWKPTECLSLGLSARYYNDIPLEGKLSATTYFANQPAVMAAIKPQLDAMLTGQLIDQATYQQLLAIYSGQQNPNIPEMTVKTDLPLPLNVGFGFAYTGIDKLLITGDVAMTQWSSWDVIVINDENGNKISQLTENWEDGIRMGLGLEYCLGFAKARLGFYSEPRAAVDETMNPTIPDVSRRNVVSLGLGVPVGPLNVGLMVEKYFLSDYTVDTWTLTEDGMGYENMAGTYTMDVFNILLGVDYSF
ncbi:outer membrane protein transport protein [candidate division KSB1 bacterium]|nr:outer membrane protein transport protein [candidate division KSB1 bacterium]